MSTITVQELREILNTDKTHNFIVLDVRTSTEHDSKRIPGTYNLPLDELEEHVQMLKTYDKVYVHCQTGGRSGKACQKLRELGLDNVVDVSGGINQWEANNFEVKTNKRIPIMQQVFIIAGSLILTGSFLSLFFPYFLAIPLFVGSGLLYAGLSGNCLMSVLLAKAPWNQVKIEPLPWQTKRA